MNDSVLKSKCSQNNSLITTYLDRKRSQESSSIKSRHRNINIRLFETPKEKFRGNLSRLSNQRNQRTVYANTKFASNITISNFYKSENSNLKICNESDDNQSLSYLNKTREDCSVLNLYKYQNEGSLSSMLKSSKSRVKTVPPINTVQKEEIIDNAIKCMTESPEKEQEDSKKIEEVKGLKNINPAIKLSKSQSKFLKGCVELLSNAINSEEINENIFLEEYKLSLSGDIFLGENDGEKPEGYGVLLTNKNELIEGKFSKGIIQSGNVKILYSNGEYYNGQVKEGGGRQGEGVHYYSNGDIYDGEFVNDQRIGKSRLRFHDGSEYIGQFIDDTADGHGLFTDKDGNRYMSLADENEKFKDKNSKENETGYFLKGKLYGKGEIKFKNGDTYVGQIKGTKRNGFGKMSFNTPQRDGDRQDIGDYIGYWKRDKRDGQGEMKYLNGSSFNGIWKNDKRYKGEYVLVNGNIYKGNFHNNEFHGPGELQLSTGVVIKGEFENGEIKNPGTIIFPDGRVFQGEIIENEIGTKGCLSYPNGDSYDGLFEERQRSGVGVLITEDGGKYEGRWQADKRNGFGKEYIGLSHEYYEGKYTADKREGQGKLINKKGEIFKGIWKANKKVGQMSSCEKMDKKEFDKFVKHFLKNKSHIEPNVRILE